MDTRNGSTVVLPQDHEAQQAPIWARGGKHKRVKRLRLFQLPRTAVPVRWAVRGEVDSCTASSSGEPARSGLDGDAEVDKLTELWSLGVLSAVNLQESAKQHNKQPLDLRWPHWPDWALEAGMVQTFTEIL